MTINEIGKLAIRISFLTLWLVTSVCAQKTDEYAVASRFAPVFYQALGDDPRSDQITNFDFDGDWRGDNNWENAGNRKFALRAYIYYALSETETHYFIHYAVFHPRDYKGGAQQGLFLSELMRRSAEIVGGSDPTGMLKHASAAHENDMEGVLVVVEKIAAGTPENRVVFLETLAHNSFALYSASERPPTGMGRFSVEGERPRLYIEPRGHGIEGYVGDAKQAGLKKFLIYRFTGKAEDPEKTELSMVGYELLPIKDTLWPKAVGLKSKDGPTYGSLHEYSEISIHIVPQKGGESIRKVKLGGVGSAFFGTAGGENMARPPWGWFDSRRRGDPLGLWFFDPASTVKRDFDLGDDFSVKYVKLPFWAAK